MSSKIDFDIPLADKVEDEEQGRQIAIDYQAYASDRDLSYGELVYFTNRLEDIATKFNLTDEFKENGIL